MQKKNQTQNNIKSTKDTNEMSKEERLEKINTWFKDVK